MKPQSAVILIYVLMMSFFAIMTYNISSNRDKKLIESHAVDLENARDEALDDVMAEATKDYLGCVKGPCTDERIAYERVAIITNRID